MFDLLDILFNIAPKITFIFKMGFEPKEEDFFELTEEQYVRFEAEGEEITTKWYLWMPKDYSIQNNEIITVNEKDKVDLLKAAKKIESYCNNEYKIFKNYEEKLYYVANFLPEEFSQGTKFQEST